MSLHGDFVIRPSLDSSALVAEQVLATTEELFVGVDVVPSEVEIIPEFGG